MASLIITNSIPKTPFNPLIKPLFIKKALDFLSFVLKNWWIAVISLVIAIFIMILIVQLSGGLKEWIKKEKETNKKYRKQTNNYIAKCL